MKYGFSTTQLDEIISFIRQYPQVDEAVLFGSRAIDTYKEASDVDIALKGNEVTAGLAAKMKFNIEEDSLLPFFFDFIAYPTITNEKLKQHIKSKGIVIYRKDLSEWKEISLDCLVNIGSSKRIFYKEYIGNGIPFYRSKEIIELHCGKNVTTELNISEDRYKEIEQQFGAPVKGDLLLTSVGTLGIPWIVDRDEKFYFKDGNLTWFRDFSDELNNRFLYYWIISPIGKGELDMVSIGSTQPALTIQGLKSIKINLPPLPEQKAIAGVLSSLDDKIDLLHRQNKTLEAMAETLFRQWFIEEAKEDWEEVDLEYVTERITDGAHKSPPTVEAGLPMASVKDMHDWGIHTQACRKISEEDYSELARNDCRPLKNDIVIAKDGSYLKHVFVSQDDLNVVILSSIAILRPNDIYDPILLSIFLKLDSTRASLENIVTGAVIPRIVLKDFRNFPILLPPKHLQLEASKKIKPLISKCWENVKQIKILEKLRDTLLPKLMSGEVRVLNVDNSMEKSI